MCIFIFFPDIPLPKEQRALLKWKMSSITPNVVKNCIARTGFTKCTSKLYMYTNILSIIYITFIKTLIIFIFVTYLHIFLNTYNVSIVPQEGAGGWATGAGT